MAIYTSIMTGGANSHETTSEEANGIATDFVGEGVIGSISNTSGVAPATGAFAVNAQGTPDMTVAVTSGVAYVTGTPTGQNSQTFRVYSSASEDVTISANSSGSTKYDWIYISLDADLLADPTLAGTTTATLVASRSSSSTADNGTPPTYGYPIAVVTVVNGASSISNSAIRDIRSGSSIGNTSVNTTGWLPSQLPTVSSVTNNGNRSETVTYASDVSSIVSVGQRHRFTRTVTAPTTSFSLDGSNDYYVKISPAGITFTDDFVVGAWVYLNSYTQTAVATRYNGSSGWQLDITSAGIVRLIGYNAAAGNYSGVSSYQSIPLDKWVHIAAQLDMSAYTATTTTSYIMIDGVGVPAVVSRAGTNPTALVQAGNLEIGSQNGGLTPFPGYIDQVFVSSAKITQANVQKIMTYGLTASDVSTYSLASAYSDGSTTDLNTTNANNLTATNGATTASVSPFATDGNGVAGGTYDYGLVTKVSTTDVTYQLPAGCTIPTSGGITTVDLATSYAPLGFPVDTYRWSIDVPIRATTTGLGIGGTAAWYGSTKFAITVPVGRWTLRHLGTYVQRSTAARVIEVTFTLYNSTVLPTASSVPNHPLGALGYSHSSVTALLFTVSAQKEVVVDSAATFNPAVYIPSSSGSETWEVCGARGPFEFSALPAGI